MTERKSTPRAPVIDDEAYGFQRVNVAAQQADPGSLWHRLRQMIGVRKQHPLLGYGEVQFLDAADPARPGDTNPAVLAFLRRHAGETLLSVNNLSGEPQTAILDLAAYAGRAPRELLDGAALPPLGQAPYILELGRYGYRWLRL